MFGQFFVDYNTFHISDNINVHKYLKKKHYIKWSLDLLEKMFIAFLNFSRSLFSMNNVSNFKFFEYKWRIVSLSIYIYFNFRGVTTGGGGRGQAPFTHFNFWNKDPTVSFSNIRYIAFNGCSEIVWTRNFTIFTVCATIFGQCMAASYFFYYFFYLHRGEISLHVGLSEKVQYVTLDLLKSFSLWAIWKKNTMNES